VSDHECEPGADPRKQNSCVKCGRMLPEPPPVVDLCDLDFEHEATRVAARQAGVNGDGLNAFATARKMVGPVSEHLTRDFRQEVAEELADSRNYLVWWLEQERHHGTLTTEKQWHIMQALGATAAAWHHITTD
jgi:hypothetical protein